eukprot:2981124-Pyramimonas_sp.AAC.1
MARAFAESARVLSEAAAWARPRRRTSGPPPRRREVETAPSAPAGSHTGPAVGPRGLENAPKWPQGTQQRLTRPGRPTTASNIDSRRPSDG